MPAVNETEGAPAIHVDVKPGGWHHDATVRIILNPEKRRVFDWSNVGPGVPEPVWHRRMLTIAIVDPNVSADALDARLRSPKAQEALRALCAQYLGSEWDGSNHVGRWSWAFDEDELVRIEDEWADLLGDLPTFWDADDWFGSSSGAAVEDALDAEDLDAWIAGEVEDALGQDVLISERGAEDWILDRFERVMMDDRQDIRQRWKAAAHLDGRDLTKAARDAVAEVRALGAWHVYDVGGADWEVEDDPIALDDEGAFLAFVDDVREQIELAYDNVVAGSVGICPAEKAGVCVELRSWDGRVVRLMGLTWDVPAEEP